MTSLNTFKDRNRDLQDLFERHVFSEIEYTETGAVIKVKGNGTEDEAVVLNLGTGFNLPRDENAEVMLVAAGSDTGVKMAIMTIPRDKQVQWAEGEGGIQHPLNPEKRIQFTDGGVWVKEGTAFLGDNKEVKITVSGGSMNIEFSGDINFDCNKLTHNGINIGDTHVHSQGADSDGNTQQNTNGPQ